MKMYNLGKATVENALATAAAVAGRACPRQLPVAGNWQNKHVSSAIDLY